MASSKLNKNLNIVITTDTRIRTLSTSYVGLTTPSSDLTNVHNEMYMWNSINRSSLKGKSGFDFQEGALKDIQPVKTNITQGNNLTATQNIWIPQRGRIMFYIQSCSLSNTQLHYQISENPSNQSTITEVRGSANTLLLCPRDEGISTNAPMTVKIWRTQLNSAGREASHSETLTLYCHTYGEPEIHITNPKKRYNKNNSTYFSENYALIATDVVNKLETEDISDVIYMCPVLSLMVSQDALDDSGITSFTRVCIKEYIAYPTKKSGSTYSPRDDNYNDYTGYMSNDTHGIANTVTNKNIIEEASNTCCTGTWVGVFNDADGSILNISGVVNPADSSNVSDTRMIWTPPERDPNFYKNQSITKDDHVFNSTASDLRVCFRAGYKYFVSVRRFHGYAAGYSQLNSAGEPQYAYKIAAMAGSLNYPPYTYPNGSLGTSISIHSSDTSSTMSSEPFYPGPSLSKYDSAYNNARAAWTVTGDSNSSVTTGKWVGPYAGETIQSEEEGRLYPGFSAVDWMVIDCVRNQTSSKNLITIRPASQEISADHWLTFGYRHLNRTTNGIDGRKYVPTSGDGGSKPAVRLSTKSYNYKGSRAQYFNRFGIMVKEGDNDFTGTVAANETGKTMSEVGETSNYFNENWNETDTTARRIGKMYTALISKALDNVNAAGGIGASYRDAIKKKAWSDWDESGNATSHEYTYTTGEGENAKERTAKCSPPSSSTLNESDTIGIQIYLKMPNEEGGISNALIYEDSEFSSTSKFKAESTRGYLRYYTYYSSKLTSLGDANTYQKQDGSWYILYSDSATNEFQYGNEYTWIPIINAQSGATWLPTCANDKSSDSTVLTNNVNNIVSDFKNDKFTAYYVEEGGATLGEVNYEKFLNIDRSHCIDITPGTAKYESKLTTLSSVDSTSVASYPYIWEGNAASSSSIYGVHNRNFSTTPAGNEAGSSSYQYFADKTSAPTSQSNPGKLYLRVPPIQDCENGSAIDYTHYEIPARQDIFDPTVRTTHILYYKTYISGDITVKLMAKKGTDGVIGTYQYPQKVSGDHDSASGKCSTSNSYTPSMSEYTDMSNFNMGNVGKTVSGIKHASSYTDKGFPSAFNTHATANHVLTVFAEDNNGLGRCLSVDDYTAVTHFYKNSINGFKYINELESENTNNVGNGGGIEVPIRVRYTPIAQPEVAKFISNSYRSNSSSNVIRLLKYTDCSNQIIVRERDSAIIEDHLKNKTKFSIDLVYGLYNDKCRGSYATSRNTDFYYRQQRLKVGGVGEVVPCTDFYPAVGICNCFMVVLFPNKAVNSKGKSLDYFNQAPNFWSNRSNYETAYSLNGEYPVIVADCLVTDNYKTYSNADKINNKLATHLQCDFDYTNLVTSYKVKTSLSSVTNRKGKLAQNIWYDLVVVPIYTSNKTIDSTRRYVNGEGTLNGNAFGGGTANATDSSNKDYYFYGSNPLVIRNYLNISSIDTLSGRINISDAGKKTSCGSSGGGSYTPTIKEPPFSVEGCILYPNVNHVRYNASNNLNSGVIDECPGFWLNNTFRVVIRAPHYRTKSQIANDSRYFGYDNYEQSLEVASNNMIENPEDFEFSDVMIHFGKYNEYVRVRDAETGEVSYDTDSDGNKMIFSGTDFQKLLNEHSLDKEWLNARNIYTVRTNPEAWSKRVPEVTDDENSIRDTIKAGSLTSSESKYADRMVVFNPNMVNAWTEDAEGFYIQTRFLNSMYAGTTQQGTWSSWCGGIMNDDADYDTSESSNYSAMSIRKDEKYEYYVPIRSYTDILTTFRHQISGCTPGSTLTTPNVSEKITVNYTKIFEDSKEQYAENVNVVKGAGGMSPLQSELPEEITTREQEDEGFIITHSSMLSNTPYVVPEHKDILPQLRKDESSDMYNPWKADNDYTEKFGYLRQYNSSIDSSKFAPSDTVKERHMTFYEMYYLEYIIRNMAKLYHSNWSEQCCEDQDMNAKDIGWSLAKEFLTNYTKWANEIKDATSATRKNKVDKSAAVVTEKFFKQEIKVEDFDSLLSTMRKLVDFTRNTKWSGNHTTKTDTIDSQGNHTGCTVLPVDSSRLDLNKCTDESDGGGKRMIINASIDKSSSANVGEKDETYYNQFKQTEGNYIDRLWKMLKELIIQDADKEQAY